MRNMRELTRDGALLFREDVEREGHEVAVRRRMRLLAENGDLAMIGYYVNQTGMALSATILSPLEETDVHVARGQIMGIRNLYHDLLAAGELAEEPMENPHIRENNPFALITEDEDSPLEI